MRLRFKYELARDMGMTVARLDRCMPAGEFERHLLLAQVRAEERAAAEQR